MQYVDFVVAISKPLTYLGWEEAAVLNAVVGREDPLMLGMTGAPGGFACVATRQRILPSCPRRRIQRLGRLPCANLAFHWLAWHRVEQYSTRDAGWPHLRAERLVSALGPPCKRSTSIFLGLARPRGAVDALVVRLMSLHMLAERV
jgi:hypothetical protein